MTWEIIALGLIIIVMMGALIKELASPEVILLLALGVLVVSGILSLPDALTGFTNQGMLTVGLLCIVAGSVQRSGLVEAFINRILSKGETQRQSLLRILIPSSILSGFLNNTPIAATFSPLVRQWCERYDVSPSNFLLPLSYATITGGTITLIGTSTNLVVHGMLVERGYDGFSFFSSVFIIGIPITIALIVFIVLLGPVLLPDRAPPSYFLKDNRKRFMMEFVVENTELYHFDAEVVGVHRHQDVQESSLNDISIKRVIPSCCWQVLSLKRKPCIIMSSRYC